MVARFCQDTKQHVSSRQGTRVQNPIPSHSVSFAIVPVPNAVLRMALLQHRNKPDETTLRLFTTSQMNNPLHPPKTAR